MNVPAKTTPATPVSANVIEQVLIKGDLSKLNEQQRNEYYLRVCESVGLNPLTQPFAYITLSGKLTLYALRNATDQLRAIHGVSVLDLTESERDGVFIVTAKMANADGRTDMAKGAVNIANLKGDALANALMKAETKAKRRATLSLCGLGMLDESEIETIPAQARAEPETKPETKPAAIEPPVNTETGEISPHRIVHGKTGLEWSGKYIAAINAAALATDVAQWQKENNDTLAKIEKDTPKIYKHIMEATQARLAAIAGEGERTMAELV